MEGNKRTKKVCKITTIPPQTNTLVIPTIPLILFIYIHTYVYIHFHRKELSVIRNKHDHIHGDSEPVAAMTALYWRDMNKKADMYYTKNILVRYGFAPWVRLLAQSRLVSVLIFICLMLYTCM